MQIQAAAHLQEGTLVRLGGKREVRVNVRLVAATNRDLAREVDRPLPPGPVLPAQRDPDPACPVLRERREDIRALALHF
jgi:Nif-specific regulatory protein